MTAKKNDFIGFGSVFHSALERVVANKFVIQMMLHNTKWHVKGSVFHEIQVFADAQKDKLYHHTEQLLERLHISQASTLMYTEKVGSLTELRENTNQSSSCQILDSLCHAFDQMVSLCHSARILAKVHDDNVTADVLCQQIKYYEFQRISLKRIISSHQS